MRILIVIYEYPPIGGGGGQAAKNIAEELSRRGHNVRVMTAHMKGLPHQAVNAGVQVTRISSVRRMAFKAGLGAMSGFVIAGLITGLRQIRNWRPDIIHVHFAVPSGPVAWGINRLSGIPYVLTAHLGDIPGGVPEKTDHWFRFIYPFTHAIWNNAAATVAVSEFTRQLALQHYPVDIKVIPNGVDLNLLDPGQIQAGNPPRIFFAGRFMPQKNPLQLIRTLANLKNMEWECVMLGDGPLREDIKREIRSHGLEERFMLPGWVKPEDVIQWLKKSDILFMPSLSEGLPVIGVQSLAMGLAIIASNTGGFFDLVDPGVNGELIDIEKTEDFTQALTNLLSNKQLLQSYRNASRNKSHSFDIKNVAEQYESLFLRIRK